MHCFFIYFMKSDRTDELLLILSHKYNHTGLFRLVRKVLENRARIADMKPHLTMWNYYRPQRSWGKVMFSQACVILLTGRVSASVYAGIPHTSTGADTPPRADTPLGADPLEQTHTPPPPGADPPGADTPREQTPGEQTPPRADTP